MNQEKVYNEFKAVVLKSFQHEDPSISDQQLQKKKKEIDEVLTLDAPLTALGWDSMTMTWLIVTREDRFEIDMSSISLMEIYSVGDLVNEISVLIEDGKEG